MVCYDRTIFVNLESEGAKIMCVSEIRSGAAAVVAEDERISERGAALWSLCAHVRLQDLASQSPAVCQARGVRHRSGRQLGGRGRAAGHPRGAPDGHHGEAAVASAQSSGGDEDGQI